MASPGRLPGAGGVPVNEALAAIADLMQTAFAARKFPRLRVI
jgi:hypothetical protein